MRHLTVIFLFLCLTSYSQSPDTCFTGQEILDIEYYIDSLVHTDSIKSELISEYEYEIQQHDILHLQDSTLLFLQEQELTVLNKSIQLHKDLYETVKPRWYDSKVIWFLNGFAAVLVSSYVVKNVK